ncbi:MAG: MarR family transcriptional regulator [Anaerolineae bacterium]|nr:MarR family transcriptional regulator [Anaerolineae bacterium]
MPTHYPGNTQEVLALNTLIKLTRAAESILARLQRQGAMAHLTISQFGVLESLYHLGPMCPSDLSTKLLKSGGNITLVLDNLEKQGLVQRERDTEDRRMIIVSLTPAGYDLISTIFPAHVAAVVEEMSYLTPEEQQLLGDLCLKLGKPEKNKPMKPGIFFDT